MGRPKVMVVGAGVAGLTAAFRLQQRGCDVTVLESEDRVGGKTASVQSDGFVVNTGATVGLAINNVFGGSAQTAAGVQAALAIYDHHPGHVDRAHALSFAGSLHFAAGRLDEAGGERLRPADAGDVLVPPAARVAQPAGIAVQA